MARTVYVFSFVLLLTPFFCQNLLRFPSKKLISGFKDIVVLFLTLLGDLLNTFNKRELMIL